jgi:hypothetical protein
MLFATEVRNLAGSTLSLGVWSAKACSVGRMSQTS